MPGQRVNTMLLLLACLAAVAVDAKKVPASDEASGSSDGGPDVEASTCQQRFPFDRRDCTRAGTSCCPGPYGAAECGYVTKSGLPKGRDLKNRVCCLTAGSTCAKNKRYDNCCQPLQCQVTVDGSNKKKCLPVAGTEDDDAAAAAADAAEGPGPAAEAEDDDSSQ